MKRVPEAPDVTEDDRKRCRTLIEAAQFHAVDYEEDGACWERVLSGGDCLVLSVGGFVLFGKPEREEWTLLRFREDGTPGGYAGPMTLDRALDLASALSELPGLS